MVADITPRKHAEEVLSSESRRLLEAQEAERARIARDLHDDIGQRLALLSIGVGTTAAVGIALRRPSFANPSTPCGGRRLELPADVQALSHELHSSKLQLLGVVPAIRGFCSEISARQKVEVDFSHQDVPGTVRPDIALCLFRVLQEALQNAVRHSTAVRFTVNLQGTPKAITLTVRDGGRGFDPASVSQDGGLGLTSMRERLKLVAGELSIESQPASGTTIVARVPLPADPAAFARDSVGVDSAARGRRMPSRDHSIRKPMRRKSARVTRIAVEVFDERREIVEGRCSVVIGLGLPLECSVEVVRPCIDVDEAMRRDVPCVSEAREFFENVAHLVARATPGVVVPEHAQIEWRAARHQHGSLTNFDRLGQPRLLRTAHAHHVNRENEIGIDFEALFAFRHGLVVTPRQKQRVRCAGIDEG